MGALETAYKNCMDAIRLRRKMEAHRTAAKSFTIARQPGQPDPNALSFPANHSGVHVDEFTALNYSAVWACVRLLSETVASLPWITYKRMQPRGKERSPEHPIYSLLHDQPNPEMTAFNFKEALMAHMVTWGNAYAMIEYEERVTPKALWLMRPDRVWPKRDPVTKSIQYEYWPMDGSAPFKLPAYRVLHIPGLGFDGVTGYSVIAMARQSLGLGLAMEDFGARFFSQGTNTGMVIKHPKTLSPTAHENLKNDLKDKYQGLGRAHEFMLIEEGMDVVKTTIPPDDAQFLESRGFQIPEVARWFRVQPHMIGDLSRATFSNIEQQSLEFVVYTMRPWFVRIEQVANMKLLAPDEKDTHFTEFLIDALLRGDMLSRSAAYHNGIIDGWLSPNEIRDMENRNPRQDGDIYLQPVNMVVSGSTPLPANQPPKEPAPTRQ